MSIDNSVIVVQVGYQPDRPTATLEKGRASAETDTVRAYLRQYARGRC